MIQSHSTAKKRREKMIHWGMFHDDTLDVIQNLPQRKWSAIIGIKRGGLVPLALFARELDMRRNIGTIGIGSYHREAGSVLDMTQTGIEVYDMPSPEIMALPQEEILIVDDVCDTGATVEYIKRHHLPNAYYVAIYVKPKGRPSVNLYCTERIFSQEDWIVFPWDAGYGKREPLADKRRRVISE